MTGRFLSAALAVTLLSALSSIARAERPNILFAFADDWGRYASAYAELDARPGPNSVVRTPIFDQLASDGALFTNAYVPAPSCTPCRSSILSGQYFFRTGRGAILRGAVWDPSIPSFPLLLRDAGYHIGQTYKVWSPGTPNDAPFGARAHEYESAGRRFNNFSQQVTRMANEGTALDSAKSELYDEVAANFDSFLADRPKGAPFCYWFGPTNVHRKWIKGSAKELWDVDPDDLQGKLPEFLPDVHEVRQDLADYLGEVMAFDAALGVLLERLEEIGEADNTLVVVSGDHGIPGFPRGKTNLYDFGTHVPLAVRWPNHCPANREITDFVNLMDLAPTFLEVGDVEAPEAMTGRSLVDVISSDRAGRVDRERNFVVTGRERHVASAREDFLPYPQRAIRTDEYLYIRNFAPDRWPEGTPSEVIPTQQELENETYATFPDMDAGPTKAWVVQHTRSPEARRYFDLAFAKRPAEELYHAPTDPDQIRNVANDPAHADTRMRLGEQLLALLKQHGDPRVAGDGGMFDRSPYSDPVE